MKAKRLVFPGKMRVEIEPFDLPDTPGPGEVLVQNLYSLISPGTELAMFTEAHVGFPIPDFAYAKYPFRPGYASVGRVLTVGKGIENIREGEILYTQSKHASHSLVSARQPALKLPDGLPVEHAPFAVLAWVALTAVRLSDVRLGHTVAVFGQGMIGNFAAQLMRCAGARRVIGIDRVSGRLSISAQCGIDVQINVDTEDLQQRIRALTGGAGCQVVVEATGDPSVVPEALRIAAQMGKVVLLGSPRGNAELDLYFDLHRTGVSLVGAHGARQADAGRYGDPDAHALMLEFIAQQRLRISPMHTHTLPVSDAHLAYTGLLEDRESFLGVLLDLNRWE